MSSPDTGRQPGPLQARVSRRRALAAGAVGAAGVAALAVAGCGSGRRTWVGETIAPQPLRGGTLRTGTTLPLSYGLDPHAEQGTGLAIFPRVFGYMLHVDPADDSIRYDQGETLEQPDATTYIVRLRDGVRYHDLPPVNGRIVTADDVVRSVERFRDHPLSLGKTWHLTLMSGVHAIDQRLVLVTTLRPYVYSLNELGGISSGAIVPRELAGPGVDFNTSGVGSGPFRIAGVSSELVRIERHDGYFNAPLPYLDAMEWRVFARDDDKTAAFQRGEIDVVASRDRSQAAALDADGKRIETVREPGLAYLSIGLRTDRPPFSDERVREAIDIGIDRDALIRDLALGEGEVTGPVNPHLAGGYWSLPRNEIVDAFRGLDPLPQRRANAKAMVERAGFDGAVVRLQVPNVPELLDVAGALREQIRQIGLDVELQTVERIAWHANFHRGSFEATLISQPPYESPDMPLRLYHSAGIDGTGSPFGFSDPQIDALVERSWGEMERETRRRTVLDAQRLMVKARPLIQLFTSSAYSSAWPYVRDRHPELVGSMAQYNYGQWLAPGQAGSN